MIDEREELLARIATLYYLHDKSQLEIAEQVAVSRSNVSRLLKEARERGIVHITIRHPLRRNAQLEEQLVQRFGLQAAGVCQTVPRSSDQTVQRIAALAARMLDELLDGAAILGISWGTTVHAVVNAFTSSRHHDVEVVQMMGGVGSTDAAIDGPALAERLARQMTGRYRYLHAPLIVDSAETAQALLAQRSIAETLHIAASADVALVGIGSLEPGSSSLLRAGYLNNAEFASIREHGAVGDICGRHFDLQGRPSAEAINQRLISVSHEQIAAIPLVIGAAGTLEKATAIHAALCGNYVDVLVTDSTTAEAILALSAQM